MLQKQNGTVPSQL
ncbi:unnamed protein product, partial [Didymodactylos carnosus]